MLKMKRRLGYAAVCLLMFLVMGMPVKAADAGNTDVATLQKTTKSAEVKATPDKGSETLAKLEAGTAVIVYGEPQDSWSRIEYKGIEGYVESAALEYYSSGEEIEEELQAAEEDTFRVMDEYELAQKDRRSSIIWGAVIAVLVAGIFAVGIVSALKKGSGDKEGEPQ